jgi:hypothetical protein
LMQQLDTVVPFEGHRLVLYKTDRNIFVDIHK